MPDDDAAGGGVHVHLHHIALALRRIQRFPELAPVPTELGADHPMVADILTRTTTLLANVTTDILAEVRGEISGLTAILESHFRWEERHITAALDEPGSVRMLDMTTEPAGLVVWDVDGTLIPADLRWLRRAIARSYGIPEADVVFPKARVHGYTDESIVLATALAFGVPADAAERGLDVFPEQLMQVMSEGEAELARDQPAYPGAVNTIETLHERGFVQTVLTGNLRSAAEVKLRVTGLDKHLDFNIGAFGSDARDRFDLPAVITERYSAKYGYTPEPARTIVIGDAPNDIACARHAGFHVIVVTHRASRKELAEHSPDAIVDALQPDTIAVAVDSLIKK